jgi:hypothetical protein
MKAAQSALEGVEKGKRAVAAELRGQVRMHIQLTVHTNAYSSVHPYTAKHTVHCQLECAVVNLIQSDLHYYRCNGTGFSIAAAVRSLQSRLRSVSLAVTLLPLWLSQLQYYHYCCQYHATTAADTTSTAITVLTHNRWCPI